VTPPANVIAFAKDLGVDSNFAWKTLDELARTSGRHTARSAGRYCELAGVRGEGQR
jgi:hypothetical protein